MPRFDASSAECLVTVLREGVLSPLGYDLVLKVTDLDAEVDLSSGTVSARFSAASLRVAGALRKGVLDPTKPDDKDRAKIEAAVAHEILDADRFPNIRFVGHSVVPEEHGFCIDGTLHLCGRARPMTFHTVADGENQVARVDVHQPHFGIKPYRAFLGALRIQPGLLVTMRLPFAGEALA